VVGLAIAYSTFRRGRRQLFSSVFAPLLGVKRSSGPLGKARDLRTDPLVLREDAMLKAMRDDYEAGGDVRVRRHGVRIGRK